MYVQFKMMQFDTSSAFHSDDGDTTYMDAKCFISGEWASEDVPFAFHGLTPDMVKAINPILPYHVSGDMQFAKSGKGNLRIHLYGINIQSSGLDNLMAELKKEMDDQNALLHQALGVKRSPEPNGKK